jgi:hypothetical protein
MVIMVRQMVIKVQNMVIKVKHMAIKVNHMVIVKQVRCIAVKWELSIGEQVERMVDSKVQNKQQIK